MPDDAIWWPWFGRSLGGRSRVIGHCDAAPWNIVARDGLPVALIDWERAGPVDPVVELAHAVWLNAKLHHDDISKRQALPPLRKRLRLLRAMVDAYGLSRRQRTGFIDRMIEVAVNSTANEADEAGVSPETRSDALDPEFAWGIAWQAREPPGCSVIVEFSRTQ